MDFVAFIQSYSRLLFDVIRGKRETSYPLGPIWRWNHKRYRDL
ncbi:MAG: hypothetical protein WBO68_12205 [Pyrinomonadaceae bacterium]